MMKKILFVRNTSKMSVLFLFMVASMLFVSSCAAGTDKEGKEANEDVPVYQKTSVKSESPKYRTVKVLLPHKAMDIFGRPLDTELWYVYVRPTRQFIPLDELDAFVKMEYIDSLKRIKTNASLKQLTFDDTTIVAYDIPEAGTIYIEVAVVSDEQMDISSIKYYINY